MKPLPVVSRENGHGGGDLTGLYFKEVIFDFRMEENRLEEDLRHPLVLSERR